MRERESDGGRARDRPRRRAARDCGQECRGHEQKQRTLNFGGGSIEPADDEPEGERCRDPDPRGTGGGGGDRRRCGGGRSSHAVTVPLGLSAVYVRATSTVGSSNDPCLVLDLLQQVDEVRLPYRRQRMRPMAA